MKLETWIVFEKEGEKQELIELIESFGTKEYSAMQAIQEKYNLSLSEATKIMEAYNKRLKKDK